VLQLPWLPKTIFRDLGEFLERLDPLLAALPTIARLGVEVRNPEFLHEELLAILRKHRVALVLSEIRGMPHPAEVVERLAVARLIGDREAVQRKTKTFDKVVLEKSETEPAPGPRSRESDSLGRAYLPMISEITDDAGKLPKPCLSPPIRRRDSQTSNFRRFT